MITDWHVHAGDFFMLRDDIQGLLTKFPFESGVDVREVFSKAREMESYLRKNGVTHAVILAECGPGTNFTIDSTLIAEFCANSPDFFIPFGNINPNFHKDPVAEWEVGKQAGVRGYKFYPADHGFDPLQPSMMAVYARCAETKLPIMFHTGLTAQREATELYIRPEEFRPIIEAFETMPVVLAHAGKPHWANQALQFAMKYKNVYLDTALVDPAVIAGFLEREPEVINKLLFGSDWPVSGSYQTLMNRYSAVNFGAEWRSKLFGANANRLLGIETPVVEHTEVAETAA